MRAVLRLVLASVAVSVGLGAGSAHAILITFEEGLGKDSTAINNQYTGITFVGALTGQSWLYTDATTGKYNASSWPSGTIWGTGNYWINDLVAAWTSDTGGSGKIAFTSQNATYVDVNYSAAGAFYLDAYNASNEKIASDSGPANLRYANGNASGPGTLHVEAPTGQLIAYVIVHDTGNYWIVDNVSTDATDIRPAGVPEPSSLVVFSLLGGAAALTTARRARKTS